jgi:hypothetical protein
MTNYVTLNETPIVTFTQTLTDSTIVANPTSVPADGQTASTITVTLLDYASNPVSGQTVALAGNTGTSSVITTVQGTTGSTGVALFTVVDSVAETVTYTATAGVGLKAYTYWRSTTAVTFTQTLTNSTIVANPTSVPADGQTASTITVTLLDYASNPVSGKTVALAGNAGTSSQISVVQGVTDNNGVAIFTVTDTVVETVTFTAWDATDVIQVTQTAQVSFVMPSLTLVTAWLNSSASTAGVQANDIVYLQFNEAVTLLAGASVSNFGLPVLNDTFGTGATLGTSEQPTVLAITLGTNPQLTPGGVYSPNALTPGSPTGIYVVDGSYIVDSLGHACTNGSIATAVDLQPGTVIVSICWDDLSITPKLWSLGAVALSATYTAYSSFPLNGLIALNNGNVVEDFSATVSAASPSGWTAASTPGLDQFGMMLNNSGPPYQSTGYTIDLSSATPPIITPASGLYSGQDQAFDLEFLAPAAVDTGAGTQQAITVTITATQH